MTHESGARARAGRRAHAVVLVRTAHSASEARGARVGGGAHLAHTDAVRGACGGVACIYYMACIWRAWRAPALGRDGELVGGVDLDDGLEAEERARVEQRGQVGQARRRNEHHRLGTLARRACDLQRVDDQVLGDDGHDALVVVVRGARRRLRARVRARGLEVAVRAAVRRRVSAHERARTPEPRSRAERLLDLELRFDLDGAAEHAGG
jgi:hypothetical protein